MPCSIFCFVLCALQAGCADDSDSSSDLIEIQFPAKQMATPDCIFQCCTFTRKVEKRASAQIHTTTHRNQETTTVFCRDPAAGPARLTLCERFSTQQRQSTGILSKTTYPANDASKIQDTVGYQKRADAHIQTTKHRDLLLETTSDLCRGSVWLARLAKITYSNVRKQLLSSTRWPFAMNITATNINLPVNHKNDYMQEKAIEDPTDTQATEDQGAMDLDKMKKSCALKIHPRNMSDEIMIVDACPFGVLPDRDEAREGNIPDSSESDRDSVGDDVTLEDSPENAQLLHDDDDVKILHIKKSRAGKKGIHTRNHVPANTTLVRSRTGWVILTLKCSHECIHLDIDETTTGDGSVETRNRGRLAPQDRWQIEYFSCHI